MKKVLNLLLEFATKVLEICVVGDKILKHWLMIIKTCMWRLEIERFDGLLQAQGEDWIGSKTKIKKLIKEKLRIENIETERAHRIGKEERDDPSQKRTIIAKFLNYKDKLWEERLYINEDISEETMEIRKELFKQTEKLRKKGEIC